MFTRLVVLALIVIGALGYFLFVQSPLDSESSSKRDDLFVPKITYPDQDVIGKPFKDTPIIQTKHIPLDALDLGIPAVNRDQGLVQKSLELPNLEGWAVSAKGALGSNLNMVQELHQKQEQWIADPNNPHRFHNKITNYDVEWQIEDGRAVGLNAYFRPTSNSAEMMALQSILVGYSSEGWQINWRHDTKPADQLGGLLEMSDGRRVFYVMRFAPDAKGPIYHPMQVYFRLGRPLNEGDFQPMMPIVE